MRGAGTGTADMRSAGTGSAGGTGAEGAGQAGAGQGGEGEAGAGVSVADTLWQARGHPDLLRLLARFALQFRPPTGFLRNFVVEHSGERRGQLDINPGGLRPIVNLARWAGWPPGRHGCSTVNRLRAAEAAGRWSRGRTQPERRVRLHLLAASRSSGGAAARGGAPTTSSIRRRSTRWPGATSARRSGPLLRCSPASRPSYHWASGRAETTWLEVP